MNSLTQYLAVRAQMRAGDVIMFSGSAGVSPLIEAATASPLSHVAVVRQGAHGADVTIIESTIEGDRNGVQTNPLGERIANYDAGGRVWWLPLSDEAHAAVDWFRFYRAIGDMEDRVKYDTPGLFECLARKIPFLGDRLFQSEHTDKMFCSGFAVELFEESGLLRGINSSKVAPQDIAEMRIYRDCIPILGAGKIARFNTI